ncbi:TPA: hypothetical protein ACVO3E_004287 [Vibrio diabolicus]
MTKSVRCKFKVISVTKQEYCNDVKMEAVAGHGLDGENAKFFGATPAGLLQLTVANDSVDHVSPGSEYYLDITPA